MSLNDGGGMLEVGINAFLFLVLIIFGVVVLAGLFDSWFKKDKENV
jgi:hypothetical protein